LRKQEIRKKNLIKGLTSTYNCNLKAISKRPVLLLEVVIALALVALCVIPLLAPQAIILSRQQRFMNEIDLDHLVNLLYADIILQLYKNEISWNTLMNNIQYEVDSIILNRVGFNKNIPFKGIYQFKEKKHKPKKESSYSIHLFDLDFKFSREDPKTDVKALTYHYDIFLIRYLESGELEILESDEPEPEEENGEETNEYSQKT
jgi:hypothetical protein